MTEQLLRSREWLLYNAVEAWLQNYNRVGTPTVAQYEQLRDELRDSYMLTLSKDAVHDTPEPTLQRRTTRAKPKDPK